MVRRYEEPIEVRAGAAAVARGDIACAPDPTPSAFLWRGRLYVVRAVIGHWRERRAWWREALDPDEDDSETRGGTPAAHEPACPVHMGCLEYMDCLEQEVWRVEASPGRLAGTGVYDLGMNDLGLNDLGNNGDPRMSGPRRGWRLLRVAD